MPAKSQAQRALLNAKFGHKWVKKHHFDNKGELPGHKTQEALVASLVGIMLGEEESDGLCSKCGAPPTQGGFPFPLYCDSCWAALSSELKGKTKRA